MLSAKFFDVFQKCKLNGIPFEIQAVGKSGIFEHSDILERYIL